MTTTKSRKRQKKQNQKDLPNRQKDRQQPALSGQFDQPSVFVRISRVMLQYPWISQTVLLVAATLLTYGWTLDVPFYLDDFSSIQENPTIFMWDGSLHSLYGPRFFPYLTFALNYKFHAFNVAGYHVVNIFIHLVNGLIILSLITSLARTPLVPQQLSKSEIYWVGLLSATIFIVHPIHIQAITYIVQRMASLAALFYLLSMLGYVRARLSKSVWGWITWGSICLLSMVSGFFTKQTTVTLPIALILLEIVFFGIDRRKGVLLSVIGSMVVLIAYILIAVFVMNINPFSLESLLYATQEDYGTARSAYLATQMRVLWLYLKMFFMPYGFCMDYAGGYTASRSFGEPVVLLAASGHIILISIGIWFFRRMPVICFGILFYYLAHMVESSVIPIRDTVFEHRTYLPDVGLVCVLGWLCGAGRIYKINQICLRAFAICVCVALGILCWQRNQEWRDPIALWQSNVNEMPQNKRAWEILGKYFILAEKYEESLNATRRSGSITLNEKGKEEYNYSHEALLNLIVANIRLKRYSMAYKLVQDGLLCDMSPLNKSKLLTNYGNILGLEGKIDEAEQKFREALKIYPPALPARINLGSVLANSNRFDEALILWSDAAKIDPDNPLVQENLAKLKETMNSVEIED